jgi:DHA2 family methylenomycin A resistance protein-like MFS transporter
MRGNRHGSRWFVLTIMCVGYFLVLLDVTAINVALPRIGAGLGSDVAGLQWVVDGYALALASLLLAGGTIGDLRGHRRVVITGMVTFAVASLACGLAPSTGVLITARVVQGIGAALLLPGTLAIISRLFPERAEQARAIGIWAGVGSVALPAGPLIGGLLVQGLGWRWVFFVNVPIVLFALVVAIRMVPSDAGRPTEKLDRWGTLLGALTLATATFAVIEGGNAGFGALVVAMMVIAVLSAIGFWWTERSTAHPMLPPALFRRPGFLAANLVAGAMNFGTLGLLFLLTLHLQSVQHRSALDAGLAVLPLFVPLTILAPLAGRLTARIGPRLPMMAGLVLAAGGVSQMAWWSATTSYGQLFPALLLWGIGMGLLTPAVVAASIAAAPADRSGLASGVNNTARQAGGAVGVAVYGAIAGRPEATRSFVAGLHAGGLVTAGTFVLAAAVTALFVVRLDGTA